MSGEVMYQRRYDAIATTGGLVIGVARSICDLTHEHVISITESWGIKVVTLKCEGYGHALTSITGALPPEPFQVLSTMADVEPNGELVMTMKLDAINPEVLRRMMGMDPDA
jgi:hypothetical protein